MVQRFEKDDYVCYVDKSIYSGEVKDNMPVIANGYVKHCLQNGYMLRSAAVVVEPFVYATREEAEHEHATALLQHLKDLSVARDVTIAKLKEYGLEGFGVGEDDDLDDLLYVRKQVEHIRSIPEDKRTPAMEAVLLAVDHPCVEGP